MSISIIENTGITHMTATEKKAINYLLENNMAEGGTKKKYYQILGKEGDKLKIKIHSFETPWMEVKPRWVSQTGLITVK